MALVSNPVAWNPADTAEGTLSTDFLTFSANAGNAHSMVRGPSGYNSGKRYFEVSFNSIGVVFNCCAGVCLLTTTVANIESGTGLHAALIMHYGFGNQGQANGSSLWQDALAPGMGIAGFAVDLDAQLLWMRPSPAAAWNDDGAADPATGTGGIDISFFGAALVTPFAQGGNSAAPPVWILNTGQSAFTGAVPSGFDEGWDNPVIPAGFAGGIYPLGTYRVLFSLGSILDNTSGIYPPTAAAGVLHGGHPQANKIYFGFPVIGASTYDTTLILFDTDAINSAGPGTALAEWVWLLDGVDVSAGLVYDGFGTAALQITLGAGFHSLAVTNIVQESAGGTYHGTAIPNTYKTDIITFDVAAIGRGVPTNLRATLIAMTSITMAWDVPGGDAPLSYILQYRPTGTTAWTQITGILGLSQAVGGLASGTLYDFQVEGVYDTGPWEFSTTVAVRTLAPPAEPPVRALSLRQYRVQVGINYRGMALGGDAYAGVIGRMNFDSFTEYGNTMRALIVSPPVHMDRLRVFVSRFEIDVESGVGLAEGQGSDPMWMLDWSKDGGRTWSSQQQWRSMGRLGAYLQRLRWLKLGQSRQWIFRLQSTDPVRRVIIGTYLDVEEGMK